MKWRGPSYEAGRAAVQPGTTFADIVHAMEATDPARWLLEQDAPPPYPDLRRPPASPRSTASNSRIPAKAESRGRSPPGIRRGDLVLTPGMSVELEPNACLGTKRVNIGTGAVVTAGGCEVLNHLPTRVWHAA